MSSSERSGSCLCGKVKLRLVGQPVLKVLCHCLSCKKWGGSIFASTFFLAKKDVEISDTDGIIRGYLDSSCDSGGTVMRSFCGICGSNVHTVNLTNPGIKPYIIIPMGVFDESEDTTPENEYFIKRRAEWFQGVEGTTEFEGMF